MCNDNNIIHLQHRAQKFHLSYRPDEGKFEICNVYFPVFLAERVDFDNFCALQQL